MSPRRHRGPGNTDLVQRLAALEELLGHTGNRLAAPLRDQASAVLAHADERLRLAPQLSVVALMGATGSGKSSLFNALAGAALSQVGVRRPMTSQPQACVWTSGAAADTEAEAGRLLDWLEVSRRSVRRDGAEELGGLVLLDLPDFDSTAVEHRLEVDRLVTMVDLLLWVVDPQKYADAVLHERYLRPLASHAEVSVIVLNQIDTLPAGAAEECLGHLRALLDDEGLGAARLLATSAVTGAGMGGLRSLLAETVQARRAAQARITADVDALAESLTHVMGDHGGRGARPAGSVGGAPREALVTALAGAAGVGAVTDAVARSWQTRCALATGLPWTRWTGRLRPDPLRRLHLGGASGDRRPAAREALSSTAAATVRSSLPSATPVQRSRVDIAVRRVADSVSAELPAPWSESVLAAARSRSDDLADALDQAVVGTDLGVAARPRWWRAAGALQLLLAATVVVGVVWLGVIFVLAWLGLPDLPSVAVGPDPDGAGGDEGVVGLPTVLVLGGLLAGALLAAGARVGGWVGARRRRRRAHARLSAAIEGVADDLVLAPLRAEVEAHDAAAQALRRLRR